MLFISFTIALSIFSAAASAANVQMEPSINVFSSQNWLKEKSVSPSDMVKCSFLLKHDKEAIRKFEKNLLEISTPSNPRYGKWSSAEEIISQISPAAATVQKVTDFIESFGVGKDSIKVSKFRDMVHVEMPVRIANQMLNTEFALFRSVLQRNVVLPRITKPYFLPSEISDVVALVDDIVRFPSVRSSRQSYGDESESVSAYTAKEDDEFNACGKKCSGNTTPRVLEQAYSYTPPTTVAKGNSMSVAEFQYQYYDNIDLNAFNDACAASASVETVIGGNNEKICEHGGCVEALLDIEYIGAVAHPIPLTIIYSGTYSLSDWADQIVSMDTPVLVHSVSYGNDEIQQTSDEYMQEVNVKFMTAGSLGLSILFASGDQGVWGRSGVGKVYNPDFPAGSPYVTAVGGTNFATKSTIGAESAWSCGGGGFSNAFARPSWQEQAVSDYLAKATAAGTLPSSTLFNSSGRAYPDVAALGGQTNPYCVAHGGGSFGGVAGTSASCPVVAGIFAQLNNVRLSAGKSSLGWLNPLIYSNPQCFNDVNDGSSNYCNAGTTGFPALTGWDAATGHGSPNFACLSKVV